MGYCKHCGKAAGLMRRVHPDCGHRNAWGRKKIAYLLSHRTPADPADIAAAIKDTARRAFVTPSQMDGIVADVLASILGDTGLDEASKDHCIAVANCLGIAAVPPLRPGSGRSAPEGLPRPPAGQSLHAPVTPAIVAANIMVFIAMARSGSGFVALDPAVAVRWGSNFGPLTVSGQWWRLLACTFIHFGGAHLLGNMLVLYPVGRIAERMYGATRYAALYLAAGMAGSCASLLWNPTVNGAGASGAVFGVFGGLLAFVVSNVVPRSITRTRLAAVILVIAYSVSNELSWGFRQASAGSAASVQVDHAAHLGGLLGGTAAGLLLVSPPGRRRRTASALVAASALVGILAFRLADPGGVRQETAFVRVLGLLAAQEQPLLRHTDDLVKRLQDDDLPPEAFCRELEDQVLPQWNSIHDGLSAAKVDTHSKQYPVWETTLHYVDARRANVRLLVGAVRRQDTGMIAQAEAASTEAHSQIEQLKHLTKR